MKLTDPASEREGGEDRIDREYVDRVDRLARICDGTPFYNATRGHAAVIVERLITDSCDSVSILSGCLEPRVYGRSRVVRATMRFLERRDCKMRIILEGTYPDVMRDNRFLKRFVNHPGVSLRIMPKREQRRYNFHFLVADGESYRIEADKSKTSAIVAFGHLEGASNLERVFGILWGLAEGPGSDALQ